MARRKEIKRLMKRFSFSFAWGEGPDGDKLRQAVVIGKERHKTTLGGYVKYCIQKVSELEKQNAMKCDSAAKRPSFSSD